MALLLLPVEVLVKIIEETIPEDFQSCALACRAIYQASAVFRLKHNELKRRYRHFQFDLYDADEHEDEAEDDENDEGDEKGGQQGEGPDNEGPCFSSLQLLLRIADDPIIARYIVWADLKRDTVPTNARIVRTHIRQAKNSSNLLSLLEKSSYLWEANASATSVLDHSIAHYSREEDGDSKLLSAFLLTLLPNVTKLSLPGAWRDIHSRNWPQLMPSLFDILVRRANDPYDSAASLSHLTTIYPSCAWGYETYWGLETFTPFLSIKSVRNFYAGGCKAVNDGYTGIPFPIPSYDSFGVGLEVVEIAGACVKSDELRTILSRMPRLRSLKLGYETKWHGCGHNMNAEAIMAAIEDEVGKTLEDLSFSILACYGEIESGIKSMKNFTRLRDLEFDLKLLVGPEVRAQGDSSMAEQAGSIHKVPSLGDLLPPTIERLCVLVEDLPDPDHHLYKLFAMAAAERNDKIPNLKEITVRYGDRTSIEENPVVNPLPDNGLETANNPISETITSQNTNSTLPQWRAVLAALEPNVNIRLGRGDEPVCATFMQGYLERYGVELTD
ncbi:hypothetical protein F5884DRAFT_254564 [Xylogone sp. PMI_703]|nr:hypothetical protein F5884DRAFT_254564 [Xylogone sp. PMI_703]